MAAAAPMIIAAVVSAVASATAAYMSYRSNKAQAAALEANANIAHRDAKMAVISAQHDTLAMSRQRRAMIGRQAALFGAGGVEMTGSPLEVMAETAGAYERDILTRGFAGDMMMRSKAFEAQLYEWQAEQKRSQATMGLTVGLIMAGAQGASGIYGAMNPGPATGVASVPDTTASTATTNAAATQALQTGSWQTPSMMTFDDYWQNNRMRSMWAGAM